MMKIDAFPLMARFVAFVASAVSALTLAGCTSFSEDSGFAAVQRTAKDRIGMDAAWARTAAEQQTIDARVAELLAKPLSAADAVQIGLLNNKGLQAVYYELGISEADLVHAGRLPNPGFVFAKKTQGDEVEIERLFTINLIRLLTIPLAMQVEQHRFAQTQRTVALQMLSLAFDVRKAYYEAVAAEEMRRYQQQVMESAAAGAELARRMAQAGNWGKLQQAREQGFYAEAALALARADQARTAARERLTRLLGLTSERAFSLPERLPELPKQADELPDIEQQAMTQRLDIQSARLGTEQLAAHLGLTKATRFINVLEFGVIHNTFSGGAPVQRGYEIAIEVPLFDWGDARVAQAQAIYMQAVSRMAETTVSARSEVRQAYFNYRTSYEIARHYRDEIVPIRKRISDENLLRYNGMLIGVFELLADARAQIGSVNGYIAALRDFWLAQADLEMSLIGRPGRSAAPLAASAPSAEPVEH